MNCNKCQAPLEEGVTLCPQCGWENAPAEEIQEPVNEIPAVEASEEEVKEETSMKAEVPAEETTEIKEGKLTAGKITLLVVLAVAAIAVIVALVAGSFGKSEDPTAPEETVAESTVESVEVTMPEGTGLNDSTCKGSYTVSDEEMLAAKDTVVGTLGDAKLTNSKLQVYYWMQFYDFMNNYGSYATMLGLDHTQPMDAQLSADGVQTWQQYFLNAGVNMWNSYSALAMEAKKNGFEMDPEYSKVLDNMMQSLEENAVLSGFENAEQMIKADMGVGASAADYTEYMNEYYLGYLYYDSLVAAIEVSDEDVEAYYTENEAMFVENGVEKTEDKYVAVRHILISPEGGTTDGQGNAVYSEDEWEACRVAAQEILDQWAAGEATEESFAALANEKSMDPGSNTTGGLYEDVAVGMMVEPFENWCFEEGRQYGDTGLVKTTYGYHIMYFVDEEPVWFATARDELLAEKSTEMLKKIMDSYELEIDYSKMVLGYVDMSQTG